MKEDIIKQLKQGLEFSAKEFGKGNYSDAYIIGYLEGTMKAVANFMDQNEVEVKIK